MVLVRVSHLIIYYNHQMNFIKLINFENVSEEEALTYKVREAARAIVSDNDNMISLLHATKNNYYKLPGGGIEKDENHFEALKRECLEEIGSEVEVKSEIGMIVEYRSKHKLNQVSYCYIAKLTGEKGKPNLTDSEISEGFIPVWLSIDEAKQKLKDSSPGHYDGEYMVARDLAFLTAYADFVN